MCHYVSYLEGLDEKLSGCIMRTVLTGWHTQGPTQPHKLQWIKSLTLWCALIYATMSHVRCATLFLSLPSLLLSPSLFPPPLLFSPLAEQLDALFLPVALALSSLVRSGDLLGHPCGSRRARRRNGNRSGTWSGPPLRFPLRASKKEHAQKCCPLGSCPSVGTGCPYLLWPPRPCIVVVTSCDWERWWQSETRPPFVNMSLQVISMHELR